MPQLPEDDREEILSTCHRALPIAGSLSDLFYGRLFSLCPEYRSLFPEDPKERLQHLVAQLSRAQAAVEAGTPFALDTVSACVQTPRPQAIRRDADESLLWALEQILGSGFGAGGQAAFSQLLSDPDASAASDASSDAAASAASSSSDADARRHSMEATLRTG